MAWTRNRPIGLTYCDTSQVCPGYTIFSSARGHHATLIDLDWDSNVVWQHTDLLMREVVWEYVSPWTVPSSFGPTPAVFRAYRIALDDPGLSGRTLDPRGHAKLNAAIAAGEVQREPEYPYVAPKPV